MTPLGSSQLSRVALALCSVASQIDMQSAPISQLLVCLSGHVTSRLYPRQSVPLPYAVTYEGCFHLLLAMTPLGSSQRTTSRVQYYLIANTCVATWLITPLYLLSSLLDP